MQKIKRVPELPDCLSAFETAGGKPELGPALGPY